MIPRKPHILHLIDSLAIGGAERMLVDIANASVADGYRVTVCITRSRADLKAELDSRIRQVILGRDRRFDFNAMRRFRSAVKEFEVDIIHVHGRSSLSFVLVSRILCLYSLKIILHDHYGIELNSNVPLWFRVFGNRILSAYIGVYEKLGYWARSSGISPSKVFVIGNGINLGRITQQRSIETRRELGIDDQTLVGLVVSGLRPEKGIDLLIESLAMLTRTLPRFRILIVGGERDPIYAKECKALAEEKGLSDLLIFMGERADVARIMRSVDFALMPSRSESGPLVLIEYMAAQLPFVFYRVGDISQRLALYNAPGIVEPNDVAGFADAVATLINQDSVARAERGKYGQDLAEKHFSIEAKMSQFYQVYNDIMSI